MPVFNQTLTDMTGRVMMARPGIDKNLVKAFLNERMRSVLDRRPTWAGLLKTVNVGLPASLSAGTIEVDYQSKTVIGTGTNWPVSDVVNTTIQETILTPNQVWVTPASMSGITRDTVLYVDGTGTPEVLPVLDMAGTRILLNFKSPHNGPFVVTTSSLAGNQLLVSGYTSPVFTILAVTSPTTLVMDQPWGNSSLTDAGYQTMLIYLTIDPMCKEILTAVDPFQQIELRLRVTQQELNMMDPTRTATQSPVLIADRGPNLCGNMQYEVWPPQPGPYQLNFLIHTQWPDLRLPQDYPPPFLNPNVLIYGAMADAYRTPCPRPPDWKDPGFNLDSSDRYEKLFEQSVQEAIMADESRYLSMYQWNYAQTFGTATMGANWNVSHSVDAVLGLE